MASLHGTNHSNDIREMSDHMEQDLINFQASDFPLTPENIQNIKQKFRDLKEILWLLEYNISDERKKELLSAAKTDMEEIVLTTDNHTLQEYLLVLKDDSRNFMFFFCVNIYHILIISGQENKTLILNDLSIILQRQRMYHYSFFYNYLNMYYKFIPNEMFTNIHAIWQSAPSTELQLKLVYCEKLMKEKEYKTLIQLIHHNVDYFITSFEVITFEIGIKSNTTITVMLHVLHHQVSICKMENVKTIQIILARIINRCPNERLLIRGFYNYITTLDNKQILGTPLSIKYLQPVMSPYSFETLEIILLCSDKLREANHYTECIRFLKYVSGFIFSFPNDKLISLNICYFRQQFCKVLLILLDSYVSCHDNHQMNLVLERLLKFREALLSKEYTNTSCYCFIGRHKCTKDTDLDHAVLYSLDFTSMTDFKISFLITYRKESSLMDCSLFYFDYFMNNVIYGQWELAPYLQSMIDMMNMDRFKEESVVFFIEFIKRSADHNTVIFYNILKMLCTIDLQREIQDLILQGFTEYLIISCNEQYSTLYKFILDINMICTKGPFLQKLTSCIAKTWLKLDDDTVNDIRKTIYHCYCTVRHHGKYEQDANIEKYKDHFTFIASMEAEEEMKKLTSLTNFLLMLTLLLIASGRHHKSAELKKYLSLKYEYRDSILYLLWCSGDVEINPGPTLCTLMKVQDSVKERNWIYEMCSILLRLLKYRSIDLKSDGLWKAKPLHWPNGWPFYDPRNKPKGQGYNAVTDRKLLENLKEQCNGKGLLKDLSKFDDEHTKSKVRQYKLEITAWKNNRTKLFELYTLRQELDTLRAAKKSLHKYKNNSELHKGISDLNVDIIFDTDNVTSISSEGYTDIVRDIAITFCRIGKGLSPLEKSDGIWKMQPNEWNPNHSYYSPCNAGKRKEKGQDQKLVDNLLKYCESKNVTIPADLQPLLKAWKQRNTLEITKYYTIWSKTAIINHSLKYLELEGLLEKCHVHESLKQIGLILDTQYWRCPSPKKVTSTNNDDKSQDSGFSDTSHSLHCSDSQTANLTNSSQKVLSFQKIKDNQLAKLTNSANANLNATDDSSCGIDSHTNDHLCNTKFDLDNQWKELSNQTCLKSDKANFSILTSKAQSEHDVQHYPVLSTDSTNSKQRGNYKKISQNTSKRKRPNEDESYSDLKRPYISESVASSSSMNYDAETKINDINNTITSDQYDDNIVNLLNDLEQDYSSTAGKVPIQDSSSSTDQPSDLSNELPEYVQLYIDTVQNSYNPDDTLHIDVDQFIEELDIE